jgi:hypothetical protein
MEDVADVSEYIAKMCPSAAEAGFFLGLLAARLKSCPSRSPPCLRACRVCGWRGFGREADSSFHGRLCRKGRGKGHPAFPPQRLKGAP